MSEIDMLIERVKGLSEYQRENLAAALGRLEAIATLAHSNFPGSTDIHVVARGTSSGSMPVSWNDLTTLCEIGRLALLNAIQDGDGK